jgi:hypothetical protein
MPADIINNTRVWGDVQSLINRASFESEINIKPPMVRNLHVAACELCLWSKNRVSTYRTLMEKTGSPSAANELLNRLNPVRRTRKLSLEEHLLSGLSGRCTDDDLSVGQSGALETLMDQEDTETEMHNDADADDTQVRYIINSCKL